MKNFFTRKGVRVVLGIFIVFLLLVLSRVPVVLKKEKSQETVGFIESLRLTMQDVDGSNLPPIPDLLKVDETLEGVDRNNNHIRDDVEHAIFEMYSDESEVELRAASLQYAMALQLYLTHVFDQDTWVAVAKQNSRANGCLYNILPSVTLEDGREAVNEFSKKIDEMQDFVFNIVLNSNKRKDFYDFVNLNYTNAYLNAPSKDCDLEF